MYIDLISLKKRLETCSSCELFNKKNYSCKSCGCPIEDISTKSFIECPEGKWAVFNGEISEFISKEIIDEINLFKNSAS